MESNTVMHKFNDILIVGNTGESKIKEILENIITVKSIVDVSR